MKDTAPITKPASRSRLRGVMIDLAIMTAVGVFLAIIGPYGSIEMPFAWRLVTWLGFAYIGYAIYRPMEFVVDRAEAALEFPRGWLWLVATMVATVPMAAVVWTVTYLPKPVPIPDLETGLKHYFFVLVIGGGVVLLFRVIGERGQGELPPSRKGIEDRVEAAIDEQRIPDPAPPNPLLDQLPAELGSDVIALEMEDHYVRVHTALGSELVLMRLRDAVSLLGDQEGMQVHRSWWVARGAVEDVVRDGRNLRLQLARGIEAPVARAKVAELRDARWI